MLKDILSTLAGAGLGYGTSKLTGGSDQDAGLAALGGGLLGYGAGGMFDPATTADATKDTAANNGFLSRLKSGVDVAIPATKLYGNISSGLAAQDLSNEQINQINLSNRLATEAYNRQLAREGATEQNLQDAFNSSALRNYYSA